VQNIHKDAGYGRLDNNKNSYNISELKILKILLIKMIVNPKTIKIINRKINYSSMQIVRKNRKK
jgi:hypothetical protein